MWLTTVIRDEEGRPTALSSGEQLLGGDLRVIDVTWAGRSQILIGHEDPADEEAGAVLTAVEVGGLPSESPLPEGVDEVTAGASASTVCVVLESGSASCQLGALWQSLGESVRSTRYAG